MRVTRFDDPRAFLERVEGFLLQDEAAHNLILGIASALARRRDLPSPLPYCAVVDDDRMVAAVALQTPPHNLILSRITDPAIFIPLTRDLRVIRPTLPGVLGPSTVASDFVRSWREISGLNSRIVMKERIFRCDAVAPVHGVSGSSRRATRGDRSLLVSWFAAFHTEALHPGHQEDAARQVEEFLSGEDQILYLWVDNGHPVSLAGAHGRTPHSIRIGPVYTRPDYRRHGYASALVAATSQALLDSGYQFCTLFTDLSNPTSNHIYQEIGYRPVCDMDQYAFDDPGT